MKDTHILVCGGAGYIGSHMVRMLLDRGFSPVVLDDLSTGTAEAVSGAPLEVVNLLDTEGVRRVFSSYPICAVMHFAAKSLVGESVQKPLLYYENNVCGTVSLLSVMREFDVSKIIFSSTAAVYGQPESTPITEDHALHPINPYGMSKAQVEAILSDCWKAYSMSSVCLRYFNACGAHPDGTLGERHNPETHLIPCMLQALIAGKNLSVYGEDYPTPDGTCVRDYIHVQDLCEAHLAALQYLGTNPGAHVFNLGTGTGYSIREIIAAAEKIIGRNIEYTVAERRKGDPAILTAVADKAKDVLGWEPIGSSLENIVGTAWKWHTRAM